MTGGSRMLIESVIKDMFVDDFSNLEDDILDLRNQVEDLQRKVYDTIEWMGELCRQTCGAACSAREEEK